MIKSKSARIAIISLLGRAVKVLTAPVTILIISNHLSNEQLGLYYTFFSIIALQQIAEIGLGHVVRQMISHTYNNEECHFSTKKIQGYFSFSLAWFMLVAIFVLVVVGCVGWIYFSNINYHVNWEFAWILLVIFTALWCLIMPFIFIIEGTQNQEIIQIATLISGIFGSITLWVCLYLNLGLYSIAISSLISTISVVFVLRKMIKSVILKYLNFDIDIIKSVFFELLPFVKRVCVVCICTFVLINSFNVIVLKTLEPDFASSIVFGFAISKAGYDVAISLVSSQITIFSNLISLGRIYEAKNEFVKYSKLTLFILISGYSSFLVIYSLSINFSMLERLPEIEVMIQIVMFFTAYAIKSLIEIYVRCFKVEPFERSSLFESILIPMCLYFGLSCDFEYTFLLCSLLMCAVCIFVYKIGSEWIVRDA